MQDVLLIWILIVAEESSEVLDLQIGGLYLQDAPRKFHPTELAVLDFSLNRAEDILVAIKLDLLC